MKQSSMATDCNSRPARSISSAAGEATTPWSLAQGGDELELEQFPGFVLTRLTASMQRVFARRYLEPHGLSHADWRVLAFVARRGPAGFGSLVAQSSLDKAQVSRTTRHLQQLGLLRVSSDPLHAQRLILQLSAAGKKLYKQIYPQARDAQLALLRALTREQRDLLHGVFRGWQQLLDQPHQTADRSEQELA